MTDQPHSSQWRVGWRVRWRDASGTPHYGTVTGRVGPYTLLIDNSFTPTSLVEPGECPEEDKT